MARSTTMDRMLCRALILLGVLLLSKLKVQELLRLRE